MPPQPQPHTIRIAWCTDQTIDLTTGTTTVTSSTFQPRCSCGWIGDEVAARADARKRGVLHRLNAVLAELLP